MYNHEHHIQPVMKHPSRIDGTAEVAIDSQKCQPLPLFRLADLGWCSRPHRGMAGHGRHPERWNVNEPDPEVAKVPSPGIVELEVLTQNETESQRCECWSTDLGDVKESPCSPDVHVDVDLESQR